MSLQAKTLNADLRRMQSTIAEADSPQTLKNITKEAKRMINQLGDKLNKLEDLASTQACPGCEDIDTALNLYMRCFTEVETSAEEKLKLEKLSPKPKEKTALDGIEHLTNKIFGEA